MGPKQIRLQLILLTLQQAKLYKIAQFKAEGIVCLDFGLGSLSFLGL